VRSALPGARTRRRRPLLFVHGAYTDAWCWSVNFLPWFARRGHPSYAVSLRGHGGSLLRDPRQSAGLDDYAADLQDVSARLPEPPVLIGHSMGAAVVERVMMRQPHPAAVLLCPVPPTGLLPTATKLWLTQPGFFVHLAQVGRAALSAPGLEALRSVYFSPDVDPELLGELLGHLWPESVRAVLELSWPLPGPPASPPPVLVLGGEGDRLFGPEQVAATAARFRTYATILPGLSHMLMLEPGWRVAAQTIAAWLDSRGSGDPSR
jgi:pimeloyl-ACP methyl ester carboxylesterase